MKKWITKQLAAVITRHVDRLNAARQRIQGDEYDPTEVVSCPETWRTRLAGYCIRLLNHSADQRRTDSVEKRLRTHPDLQKLWERIESAQASLRAATDGAESFMRSGTVDARINAYERRMAELVAEYKDRRGVWW